jgi:hypothetical protein
VTHADQDFATVRDFIGGRLSDDERRAFEDRLVREPQLVQELEQSLRMREGLQQLRARGYFGRAAFRGPGFRIWLPTLAAAAVAGVALFLWLSRVAAPAPLLAASAESSSAANRTALIVAHFTFVSMRGGSTPDLEVIAAGLIEIRAAPGARRPADRYRVTLVRQPEQGPAQTVAVLAGLAVNTDGYVHCYADASRLAAGSYVLRIQRDTDAADVAEVYPFNLRVRETPPTR